MVPQIALGSPLVLVTTAVTSHHLRSTRAEVLARPRAVENDPLETKKTLEAATLARTYGAIIWSASVVRAAQVLSLIHI